MGAAALLAHARRGELDLGVLGVGRDVGREAPVHPVMHSPQPADRAVSAAGETRVSNREETRDP